MTYDSEAAVTHLRATDPALGALIDRVGPFAMRVDSSDPFRALARAIIFQQLSGVAAGTIYGRVLALLADGVAGETVSPRRSSPDWDAAAEPFPPPRALLAVSLDALRAVGLSRRKGAYLQALATHFAACQPCSGGLAVLSDDDVLAHLTALPGIGRWTAEMFLIFHLGRPDVLPVNDVGINRAIKHLYDLETMPAPAQVQAIGAPWRPYASVACWYLWRSEDTVLLT